MLKKQTQTNEQKPKQKLTKKLHKALMSKEENFKKCLRKAHCHFDKREDLSSPSQIRCFSKYCKS